NPDGTLTTAYVVGHIVLGEPDVIQSAALDQLADELGHLFRAIALGLEPSLQFQSAVVAARKQRDGRCSSATSGLRRARQAVLAWSSLRCCFAGSSLARTCSSISRATSLFVCR